jgi:hypothetical protein
MSVRRSSWSSAERLGVSPGWGFADDPDVAVERLLELGSEGGGERGERVGVTTKIRSSSLVTRAPLSGCM